MSLPLKCKLQEARDFGSCSLLCLEQCAAHGKCSVETSGLNGPELEKEGCPVVLCSVMSAVQTYEVSDVLGVLKLKSGKRVYKASDISLQVLTSATTPWEIISSVQYFLSHDI